MREIKPMMYKKSIFDINYDKLKKQGIKLLLFDFDNTLISKHTNLDLEKFFNDLKKSFSILIVSNTILKHKLNNFSNKYDIRYIYAACKPFNHGFNKINKYMNLKSEEICIIGDQLLTDVYGGLKNNYYTVLVDPFEKQELLFTKINRIIENKIFKRGSYYE